MKRQRETVDLKEGNRHADRHRGGAKKGVPREGRKEDKI